MTRVSGASARTRSAATVALESTDIGRAEGDLSLEVAALDDVVVDDPDRADSGGCQVERHRRADAAGAEHADTCRREAELSDLGDLGQP